MAPELALHHLLRQASVPGSIVGQIGTRVGANDIFVAHPDQAVRGADRTFEQGAIRLGHADVKGDPVAIEPLDTRPKPLNTLQVAGIGLAEQQEGVQSCLMGCGSCARQFNLSFSLHPHYST